MEARKHNGFPPALLLSWQMIQPGWRGNQFCSRGDDDHIWLQKWQQWGMTTPTSFYRQHWSKCHVCFLRFHNLSTKSVAVGLVEDGDFQETWKRRRMRRERAMRLERPRYQGSGDIDDGEVMIGILCKRVSSQTSSYLTLSNQYISRQCTHYSCPWIAAKWLVLCQDACRSLKQIYSEYYPTLHRCLLKHMHYIRLGCWVSKVNLGKSKSQPIALLAIMIMTTMISIMAWPPWSVSCHDHHDQCHWPSRPPSPGSDRAPMTTRPCLPVRHTILLSR